MKLFRETIIILGIYMTGLFISHIFSLSIPGNVLGMLILLVLLCFKIIKVEQIETITNFFLDHLAFFFIPAGVGLISSFGVIKSIWLQLLIVCVITTAITMGVTGKTVELITNRRKKEDNKDESNNR